MLEEKNTVEITMERVLDPENLKAAWIAVKANDGAPGIDGMDMETSERHLREHWGRIREKLLEGRYKPAAIRAVDIPKGNGGVRTLGIPNICDRLIQESLHQRLSPVWEEEFHEKSYGFRPGRSAHDAVRQAQKYVGEGKRWVVDIDLKNFFDRVDHDKLMGMVGRKTRDKRVLRLIGDYLRAPMVSATGQRQWRKQGTPQGGPLSPLLANIYLTPLDQELEKRGLSFVRYADDIAIFCSSPRSAQRVMEGIIEWIEKNLKLEVNREKSGSGPSDESGLLGFRLYEDGRIGVTPKTVGKIKEKVRELWEARQNLTSEELREQWQGYIRGWWNYYRLADWRREITDLSGWIRRHMRKCFWLRWKTPRGRLNALKRLGVKGPSLGNAYCSRGAWVMASHWCLHQALKAATLNKYGFILPWELAKD